MFIWVSNVAFRAVNSGSCVIAAFKCAAFADKSLRRMRQKHVGRLFVRTYICAMSLTSLTPVERVISAASCL